MTTPGTKRGPCRSWTDAETRRLMDLAARLDGAWSEIGRRLGRSESSSRGRYLKIMRESGAGHRFIPAPAKITPEQAAARDDRARARDTRDSEAWLRGDVTPFFFGDPEPGRSALDRRAS